MSSHNGHTTDFKKESRAHLLTLLTLLFLTIVTVGASYIDFGSGNIVIALAIATLKASVVALFFMHLLHDKPVNSVIAVSGFLFLGLFLTFVLLDLGYRKDSTPQNCPPNALCSGARFVPPGGEAAAGGATPAPAADKRE
ncbi:MAG: cytochrome C oxidase subunit IV family protein [Bryobacteraceae bacterium]